MPQKIPHSEQMPLKSEKNLFFCIHSVSSRYTSVRGRSQQTYHHSLVVTTMRYKTVASIILCVSSGLANTSQAVDESSAGKDAAAYEAAIAEFREIICVAAVDVDSPIHQQALSAVKSHRYTDSRFADFFRDAMTNQGSDLDATKRKRESAMGLLPFTSMESAEKATLLLDALAGEEEGFLDWIVKNQRGGVEKYQGTAAPVSSIVSVLQKDAESWSSLLKDRLNVDPPTAIYCTLARYSRPSPELVALLLKATHSEQPGIRLAAIDSLDSMVSMLERESRSKQLLAANGLGTMPQVDEKFESYARKIIGRHDTNGDNALTANEWKSMLVDPAPADLNQDGRVTIDEYARFLIDKTKS